MKIYNLTFWILLSILASTTTIVAQSNNSEPTDFGSTGETGNNPDDAPAAPINIYLIVLGIAGISYAFFIQRKFSKINSCKKNKE